MKNQTTDILLKIGIVGGAIGGVFFAKSKGYKISTAIGLGIFFASPFIITNIIVTKNYEQKLLASKKPRAYTIDVPAPDILTEEQYNQMWSKGNIG